MTNMYINRNLKKKKNKIPKIIKYQPNSVRLTFLSLFLSSVK